MKRELIDYDKDSKEASIKLSERNASLTAYCPYLESHELKNEYDLIAFLPDNIMRTCDKESIVKTGSGYYSYRIIGKLIERTHNKCKVSVKDLIINSPFVMCLKLIIIIQNRHHSSGIIMLGI